MRHVWTDKEISRLKSLYPNTNNREIAEKMGMTYSQIMNKSFSLGLVKSKEFFESSASGRFKDGNKNEAGRFSSGHTPWNKGKNFNAGGRSTKTRFKPGNEPHNTRPIGSERVDKDGILIRKVSDTRVKKIDWRPVHVLVWEDKHGPVPEGKLVIFKDGNKRNFDVENLLCLGRDELMHRNNRHNRYSPELNELIQLRGVLNRKIRERHEKSYRGS